MSPTVAILIMLAVPVIAPTIFFTVVAVLAWRETSSYYSRGSDGVIRLVTDKTPAAWSTSASARPADSSVDLVARSSQTLDYGVADGAERYLRGLADDAAES